MNIDAQRFRIDGERRVRLAELPTQVAPVYRSKQHYREMLARHVARLSARQQVLFASNSHAILLIFQAMDAAGKDGAIRHVMSGVNPQGCQVHSYQHPAPRELQHDFLWRTTVDLPERGRIGIFNRSYYEEVLIARVHPEILRSEGVPAAADEEAVWRERYRSIRNLERHLSANGTRIIKVFLHVSREEQKKRLLARIDDPKKNWKFALSDIQERAYWPAYMAAYEECLARTSTRAAPWYVVPADDKKNARLIVSRIVLDALRELGLRYPRADARQREVLQAIRRRLLD
ncbi:ADP-polyphosphate phosphotransferase [Massilia sp. LC238]|uniref:ADP-polyphosphate phosphotransferase n=1 Tax=Massilia sp. LC238 TaxID=1502852 RepID=UPI0004E3E938|nr:ADP-polyphosphate phosphotransferase [Massilia sp. LC238]KFC61407.1 PPK2 family polyphosphate:nucleotide phosphotransferase [Massilia sp. LC238]